MDCEELVQHVKEIVKSMEPIKEVTNWDEQRVRAYMRYVENSEKKIMKLDSNYIKGLFIL